MPRLVLFIAAVLLTAAVVRGATSRVRKTKDMGASGGGGDGTDGVLGPGEHMGDTSHHPPAHGAHHVGVAGSDTDANAVREMGVAAPLVSEKGAAAHSDTGSHGQQQHTDAQQQHTDAQQQHTDAQQQHTDDQQQHTDDQQQHTDDQQQHTDAQHTDAQDGDSQQQVDSQQQDGDAQQQDDGASGHEVLDVEVVVKDIPLPWGLKGGIKVTGEMLEGIDSNERKISGMLFPHLLLDMKLFMIKAGLVGKGSLQSTTHGSFGDMFEDLCTALLAHVAGDMETEAHRIVQELHHAAEASSHAELPDDALNRVDESVQHVRTALEAAQRGDIDATVAALDVPGLRAADHLHKGDLPFELTSEAMGGVLGLWDEVSSAQREQFERVLDAHGKTEPLRDLGAELDGMHNNTETDSGHVHVFVMGVYNAAWGNDDDNNAVEVTVQALDAHAAVMDAGTTEEQSSTGAYVPVFEDVRLAAYDLSEDARLRVHVRVPGFLFLGGEDYHVDVLMPNAHERVKLHTADLDSGATLHYAVFFKEMHAFEMLEQLRVTAEHGVFKMDTVDAKQNRDASWSWRMRGDTAFVRVPADPLPADDDFAELPAATRVTLVALERAEMDEVTPDLLLHVQLARVNEGLRNAGDGAATRLARRAVRAFRVAFGAVHQWKLASHSTPAAATLAQGLVVEALHGAEQVLSRERNWRGAYFQDIAEEVRHTFMLRLVSLVDSISAAVDDIGLTSSDMPAGTGPERRLDVDADFLITLGAAVEGDGLADGPRKGQLLLQAGWGLKGTAVYPNRDESSITFHTNVVAKLEAELSAHSKAEAVYAWKPSAGTRSLEVSLEFPMLELSHGALFRMATHHGPPLLALVHDVSQLESDATDLSDKLEDLFSSLKSGVDLALQAPDVAALAATAAGARTDGEHVGKLVVKWEVGQLSGELRALTDVHPSISALFEGLPNVNGHVRTGWSVPFSVDTRSASGDSSDSSSGGGSGGGGGVGDGDH